jgi:alkaline phosphatase D
MDRKIKKLWKCGLVPFPLLSLLVLSLAADGAEEHVPPVKPVHVVTLGEAHRGDAAVDTRLLDSYGRPPEETRRFYLAARQILEESPGATPGDPGIIAAAKKAGLRLISGPMLGDVSESGITVWFRPVHEEALTVEVITADGQKRDFSTGVNRPGGVTRVKLTDLPASTRHTYRIVDGGGGVLGEGTFQTAPEPQTKETIRIAFGSCFHKIGMQNPNLMRLIGNRGNRALLLLGDLAVDGRNAKLNMHYADYLLRDVSRPWRALSANIPVYASWDDWDYLHNDKSGLQKGQISDSERNALRALWEENWNNPSTAVEDRGIYFNTVIGDIEIIMLDTRSCRDWQTRNERGSFLGDAQMEWLFATLKASRAKFIILTSGTMWSDYITKGKDSWGEWDPAGREEIFRFIEDNQIGGVLLLSGDRHGARAFAIPRPAGFAVYEFEAASLGGVPGPAASGPDKSTQLFGYPGGLTAFGEFTFDMGKPDPEVTFRLIDEENKELKVHTFRRSQLTPRRGDPGR